MNNKLPSGRWLFTFIVAITFLILSISGRMPMDKVHDIVLIVIYAYFTRSDRKGGAK